MQRLRLLDAVAEEVVGVGAGGEVRRRAARRARRSASGSSAARAGRPASSARVAAKRRPATAPATAPSVQISGRAVGEFGGEGLGRVAVRGDGGAAAFGGVVEAVGDDCWQGAPAGRLSRPSRSSEREQRGEQRPQASPGVARAPAGLSASYCSCGAVARRRPPRPWAPSDRPRSERAGVRGRRRRRCSRGGTPARRGAARPGSLPSVVAISSRSTGRPSRAAPSAARRRRGRRRWAGGG